MALQRAPGYFSKCQGPGTPPGYFTYALKFSISLVPSVDTLIQCTCKIYHRNRLSNYLQGDSVIIPHFWPWDSHNFCYISLLNPENCHSKRNLSIKQTHWFLIQGRASPLDEDQKQNYSACLSRHLSKTTSLKFRAQSNSISGPNIKGRSCTTE